MRFPTTGALWARLHASHRTSVPGRTTGRRRLLAPLVGAAVLISANLGGADLAAAATYRLDSNEVQLADMINDYRQSKGLSRLWVSPGLSSWANWRSADMCKRDYLSHTIPAFSSWPGGANLLAYWKRYGSYYRTTSRFSELIARNGGGSSWVATMFGQWRASSLHNSMILSFSGKYDRVGIGTYMCPNGRKYGTIILVNMP